MSKNILEALGKIDVALGGQADDAINIIDALNQISDRVEILKTSVDDINSMEIQILNSGEYNSETGVPTVENPVKGTFYLTPAKNEEDNNIFNEYYINDNGEWEMFGSASIDVNSLFDLSDRMAKGIDDNGNVVNGAVIEGSVTGNSKNKAFGVQSHAEGYNTTASGDHSHTEGRGTIANHKSQHVFGEYNVEDASTAAATARGAYVEIVGNGTSSSAKSNARTLDWSGNESLAGSLTLGLGTANQTTITAAQLSSLISLIGIESEVF